MGRQFEPVRGHLIISHLAEMLSGCFVSLQNKLQNILIDWSNTAGFFEGSMFFKLL